MLVKTFDNGDALYRTNPAAYSASYEYNGGVLVRNYKITALVSNEAVNKVVASIDADRRKSQQEAEAAKTRQNQLEQERWRQRQNEEAAKREACLSNGEIGVCQVSKGFEIQNFCNINPIVAWQNLFEPSCYYVDKNYLVANLQVRNNFNFSIKDVTFLCQQIAPSGTVLKADESTIYELWQSGKVKKLTLKFFKADQATNLFCKPIAYSD